jgi:hypothetical protein
LTSDFAYARKHHVNISNISRENAADPERNKAELSDSEPECINGERACKVNRAVSDIESEITGLAQRYKSGSMWDPPQKIDPNESAGKKFAKYTLMVPTYIVRGVTWPIALVGYELVKHGVIRKVVDIVSNDARTFWVYPKLEMGFGSGFGGGVGFRRYDLFKQNYVLGGSYQIHINMNQEAYLSFGTREAFYMFDKNFGFNVRADFTRDHVTNYYGIGPQTSQGGLAKYGIDIQKTGAWVGTELFHNLSIKGKTSFEWDHSRGGSDGPSVQTVYPASSLASFGRSLYFLELGLDLIHDTRDSDIIPERGGMRKIGFSRYQGLGTTIYDYNQYNLDVVQYIPALMPRHALVLRTKWIYQQQTSNAIPFYRLVKLDVNSPMRGFDYGRFTDRGLVVFNVEYRFPVWRFLDGQFFFDTGRVFHSLGDFSFKHFRYDGGIGLRFRTSEFFLMRFQAAYGGEGVKFLVKTSQAF